MLYPCTAILTRELMFEEFQMSEQAKKEPNLCASESRE